MIRLRRGQGRVIRKESIELLDAPASESWEEDSSRTSSWCDIGDKIQKSEKSDEEKEIARTDTARDLNRCTSHRSGWMKASMRKEPNSICCAHFFASKDMR